MAASADSKSIMGTAEEVTARPDRRSDDGGPAARAGCA